VKIVRTFRKKKRENLKELFSLKQTVRPKMSDLCRGINEFKRGYQPRTNLVKDENDDLLAASHNVLNRWKNCFPQLLNVHMINDVRQTYAYS
jgi:hypothetical protein